MENNHNTVFTLTNQLCGVTTPCALWERKGSNIYLCPKEWEQLT